MVRGERQLHYAYLLSSKFKGHALLTPVEETLDLFFYFLCFWIALEPSVLENRFLRIAELYIVDTVKGTLFILFIYFKIYSLYEKTLWQLKFVFYEKNYCVIMLNIIF